MRSVVSELFYGRVRSYFQCKENVFTSDQIIDRGVCSPSRDDLNFAPVKFQILNSNLITLDLATQLPAHLLSARGLVRSGHAVLEDAYLIGKDAYAVYRDRLVLDSCQGRLEYPLYRGDVRSLLLRNICRSDHSVNLAISLVNGLAKNYFHFLIETLPCIQHVNLANEAASRCVINSPLVCFVPNGRPRFVDDWLTLTLGDSIQLVEWRFKKIQVNNLIVPTLPYRILSPDPNPIRGVQRYLASSLIFVRNLGFLYCKSVESVHLPRKIFISRKGSSRVIVNEVECDAILIRHGYTKVYLEDLAIPSQVALFRYVTHLVAIHGAGLSNLVFANDCKLIELYPVGRDPQLLHYYCQLSTLNSISHTVMLCKADKHWNIHVDILSLQRLL